MTTRLRRAYERLAAEVLAAVVGRLTSFHLAGFLLAMVALIVAPAAFPQRGFGWRALIAMTAAFLGYWAGFVATIGAAGCVLGILHLLGVRPPGEDNAP